MGRTKKYHYSLGRICAYTRCDQPICNKTKGDYCVDHVRRGMSNSRVPDRRNDNCLKLLSEDEGKDLFLIGQAMYVGERLHIDHFVPKSRGGLSTRANLRVISESENLWKQARLPGEIYAQLALWPKPYL